MQQTLEQWVEMLLIAPLPVLARSVVELEKMRQNEDRISGRHISNVVLHDPIMTVKVLRYLQEHRSKRQSAEITTIERALMMLGLSPFFEHFGVQDTIEASLANFPEALHGAWFVAQRAHLAALYAHDWAQLRHDIDPEEIMVAALLHDLAEILVWCFAPELALQIEDMQRKNRMLRSVVAQTEVLGFPLIELQLAMAKAWQLPGLLHLLLDDHHVNSPRVVNVVQATAIARHSARGWNNAALPDDYATVGRLLGLSRSDVARRVMDISQRASHDSIWYRYPETAPQDAGHQHAATRVPPAAPTQAD